MNARYEKSKTPQTIEELDSEEKKLEKQLADTRAKKQAKIEEKQFKFLPCFDGKGVLIKKQANQFALTLADAEELVIRLDDYLKDPRPLATAKAGGM